jgi:hypothetical protein
VTHLITELNRYPNIYFEIANELSAPASFPWHNLMIDLVSSIEDTLPNRHLISDTIYTSLQRGGDDPNRPELHPKLNVLNFHHVDSFSNISALVLKHPDKIVTMDENAWGSSAPFWYRRACFSAILSGAALFDTIDYSFQVGKEDGSGIPEFDTGYRGGGGPMLRAQVGQCREFFASLDIEQMRPGAHSIELELAGGAIEQPAAVRHADGTQVVLYASVAKAEALLPHRGGYNLSSNTEFEGECHAKHGELRVLFSMPAHGDYTVAWLEPESLRVLGTSTLVGGGTAMWVGSPSFECDILAHVTPSARVYL